MSGAHPPDAGFVTPSLERMVHEVKLYGARRDNHIRKVRGFPRVVKLWAESPVFVFSGPGYDSPSPDADRLQREGFGLLKAYHPLPFACALFLFPERVVEGRGSQPVAVHLAQPSEDATIETADGTIKSVYCLFQVYLRRPTGWVGGDMTMAVTGISADLETFDFSSSGELDGRPTIRHSIKGEGDLIASAGMSYAAMAAVALAADPAAVRTERRMLSPARRALLRAKGVTGFSYEIVAFVPDRVPATKGKPLGGTHASPRAHDRRGHWRACKSGKIVWVSQCRVGDETRGEVVHDYVVATNGGLHA
jgi:hypothetical protein